MCKRNCCSINYICSMDTTSMDCKYHKRVNGHCYYLFKGECCNLKAQTEMLKDDINNFFESYHENLDQTTEQLTALLLNKAINENLAKELIKGITNGTNS